MPRGARRSPAKISSNLFGPTAGASAATPTLARQAGTVHRVPLPHDWRDHVPNWRITAMLNKIPQSDYLDEVRQFECHHISAGTLSADWGANWHAWCRRKLIEGAEREPETLGLFDP